MANGILKVGEITTSSGSGNITIGSGVTVNVNRPAFEAKLSANQTITDNTITKVQINSEVYDTDNCYDNSTNYRFTPTQAGKYLVYGKITTDTDSGANLDQASIYIYKNGASISRSRLDARGNTLGAFFTCNDAMVVDMNGSTDYLEIYSAIDDTSGNPSVKGDSTESLTNFGAYKLGA